MPKVIMLIIADTCKETVKNMPLFKIVPVNSNCLYLHCSSVIPKELA